MLNQIQLQELKDVIYKANPSLLDLKLGCEVLDHELGRGIILQEPFERNGIIAARVLDVIDGIVKYLPFYKERLEILGSPILLQHVLIAISYDFSNYAINDNGDIFSLSRSGVALKTLVWWDLTKNYDEQSEKTKMGLWNLLVTK
jgi:hypothetical protein